MTLGEFFEDAGFTKQDLELQRDLSDYWESAADFVLENWGKDIADLTPKQFRWAEKIVDGLSDVVFDS